MNLDLGHRLEILIDLAISPGATQITRLGDDIRLTARKLDGDVVVKTQVFSTFGERRGQRLRLLRPGLGPGGGFALAFEAVFIAIIFSVAVIALGFFHRLAARSTIFRFPRWGFWCCSCCSRLFSHDTF